MRCKRLVAVAGLAHIHENTMLKRITAICVVLCLALPTFSASASAHSILWAAISDHTDLVKDEEYETASALMTAVPGVEVASESVECEDGLEILYEESVPEELAGVKEEPAPELISVKEEPAAELISVEEEPEAPEEIELEEITNDEIQIP